MTLLYRYFLHRPPVSRPHRPSPPPTPSFPYFLLTFLLLATRFCHFFINIFLVASPFLLHQCHPSVCLYLRLLYYSPSFFSLSQAFLLPTFLLTSISLLLVISSLLPVSFIHPVTLLFSSSSAAASVSVPLRFLVHTSHSPFLSGVSLLSFSFVFSLRNCLHLFASSHTLFLFSCFLPRSFPSRFPPTPLSVCTASPYRHLIFPSPAMPRSLIYSLSSYCSFSFLLIF